MNIRELRTALGDTQSEFAARYDIPFRTIQNWETGGRIPPVYFVKLLEARVQADLLNRKTVELPKYNDQKKNLPQRRDYIGAVSWIKAVQEYVGEDFVFALDEALMCEGLFKGRSDEYIIWGYGANVTRQFNGVVLLGNHIDAQYVREKNGIRYTEFNRTIVDALANEAILDMQGITEALSHYYYTNEDSFDGIFVSPEYANRFAKLTEEAINYYVS